MIFIHENVFEMPSANWRPFWFCPNVLKAAIKSQLPLHLRHSASHELRITAVIFHYDLERVGFTISSRIISEPHEQLHTPVPMKWSGRISNAFSWMKINEFRLKFHWSLFLMVQSITFQHWFTMAWRLPGDKPLSEPMMVSLLTHICVIRPQWINCFINRPMHVMCGSHQWSHSGFIGF